MRAGCAQARPNVIVEARRRAETGPIGLGLPPAKKVGGAVDRNRARRRLREAARQLLPELGRRGSIMCWWRGNPPRTRPGRHCLTILETR